MKRIANYFMATTGKAFFLTVGILGLFQLGITAQTRTLPTVLTELSEHYEVFFSYDLEQIKTKVTNFKIATKESADQAVERLLNEVDLQYDRFEEKYYVIYKKVEEQPIDTSFQQFDNQGSSINNKQFEQKLSSFLVDGKEDIPISDAFVFIRNTSISTSSDLTGRFQLELKDFANGELVITHINYQTLTIRLSEIEILPDIIRLSPKDLTFAAVNVKSKRGKSKKRKQWLKQFSKAFFGEGSNRKKMKLLNPEVVWFQEKDGELIAEAIDYLSIYNGAMGYQMRFYLEEFRTDADNHTVYAGKVYFEDKINEVLAKKKVKAQRMHRRRKITYQRSKKYFFRSLITGELDHEQFPFGKAFLDENLFVERFTPWTYDSLNIHQGANQDTLFIDGYFGFANKKIVTEWGSTSLMNNYASAFLKAKNGRIILDHSGDILNPKEIEEIGYWTTRRLANLMPREYNFIPPKSTEKTPDEVVSKLAQKISSLPQEKVYLHLNKPYYSLTESIWFKAYLLNAHNHTANTLSNVVYVDLIDPDGQIEKSWTLHTDKIMDGDFRFNSKHQAGEYTIRAYTQYMRNEPPNYFFKKSFWVYDYSVDNNLEIIGGSLQSTDIQSFVNIDLFPEGGDLVNGLESNIAFKTTDLQGNPLDIVGEIRDEKDQLITKIKTNHEGLGLFNLIPKLGSTYKAFFEINKTSYTFQLPSAKKEGGSMRVNNRNADKIFIDLKTTSTDLADGAFLVGHVRGQIFCFLEEIDFNAPIVFNKKDLPVGIAHFTLFNAENQPLAERLIFNEVGLEADFFDINSIEKQYQPRAKINLKLADLAKQEDWETANLSLSVTDKSVVNYSPYIDHIQSYLALNSDLKIPIPNPNFYLENMDNTKRFWLDLWMMTHGWRRFVWQDLEKDQKEPLAFLPETGYGLKGYTTEKKNKAKRLQTQVLLTSLDKDFIYETQMTDENGNFHFKNLPYVDSISFIIQGRVLNRKNGLTNDTEEMKLEGDRMIDFYFEKINHTPIVNFKKGVVEPSNNTDFLEKYLNYEKHSKVLDSIYNSIWEIDFDQEVVVKAKRKPPYRFGGGFNLNRMDWVEPNKSGTFLMSYLYTRYNFITDFQTGTLNLISREGMKKPISIDINGFGADKRGSNPARFLSLTVDNIDYIYFDPNKPYISVITRDIPRSLQIKLESGVLNYDHPGYAKAREFYAPNYATPLPIHSQPDLRTAIHWMPNVLINKEEETTISFYAADTPTTYEVRMEGVTDTGKAIVKKVEVVVE